MCQTDVKYEKLLNDWVASGVESPKIPNERLSMAECVEDVKERVKQLELANTSAVSQS